MKVGSNGVPADAWINDYKEGRTGTDNNQVMFAYWKSVGQTADAIKDKSLWGEYQAWLGSKPK